MHSYIMKRYIYCNKCGFFLCLSQSIAIAALMRARTKGCLDKFEITVNLRFKGRERSIRLSENLNLAEASINGKSSKTYMGSIKVEISPNNYRRNTNRTVKPLQRFDGVQMQSSQSATVVSIIRWISSITNSFDKID